MSPIWGNQPGSVGHWAVQRGGGQGLEVWSSEGKGLNRLSGSGSGEMERHSPGLVETCGWWKPVADQKENRKGRFSFHPGPMRGGPIRLRNRELEERF